MNDFVNGTYIDSSMNAYHFLSLLSCAFMTSCKVGCVVGLLSLLGRGIETKILDLASALLSSN